MKLSPKNVEAKIASGQSVIGIDVRGNGDYRGRSYIGGINIQSDLFNYPQDQPRIKAAIDAILKTSKNPLFLVICQRGEDHTKARAYKPTLWLERNYPHIKTHLLIGGASRWAGTTNRILPDFNQIPACKHFVK